MEGLTHVIDAYSAWKRGLMLEITRYRSWLEQGRLNSEQIDEQLNHAIKVLRTDRITLAFLGEFSRGKTELINSLFFSDYSQRVLPSQAGRTTMCPTEIFFDPQIKQASISLLPVETRKNPLRLDKLKADKSLWLTIPLDPNKPDTMIRALAQVAQRKAVTAEEALSLGFAPDKLEQHKTPGYVMIPAWRHALINFDHPLLRNGLRVLDTPGLNALGSEPELTLSMLPSAQAIVMMLSADTGVTASEMAVWQDYIAPLRERQHVDVVVALNKIDMLWDDISGFSATSKSLAQVRATSAQQLGLNEDDILPVSAKQGLLAKVRNDQRLLMRSELPQFEHFISHRLLERKEQIIEHSIVSQVLTLLTNSRHVLQKRQLFALEEYRQLKDKQLSHTETLQQMTLKAKQLHRRYQQQMLSLKSNQRVLKHQGDLLADYVRLERIDQHKQQAYQKINSSLIPFGFRKVTEQFFKELLFDLQAFTHEAFMANQRVKAIYGKHNSEHPEFKLEAPQIEIDSYHQNLQALQAKAQNYSFSLKHLLAGQAAEGQRYFISIIEEAVAQHSALRHKVTLWSNAALMPLMQQSLENKQMLENQMLHLKALAQKSQQTGERYELLNKYHEDIKERMLQVDAMIHKMRQPAPFNRQNKVVNLASPIRS